MFISTRFHVVRLPHVKDLSFNLPKRTELKVIEILILVAHHNNGTNEYFCFAQFIGETIFIWVYLRIVLKFR